MEEKPDELYHAYSNLYIQAENTSYLSKLLAATWSRRANETTNNNKQKQQMEQRSQMFHNLSSAAGDKAEAAKEKVEKLREEYDFDPPEVSIFHSCSIMSSYQPSNHSAKLSIFQEAALTSNAFIIFVAYQS